MKIIKDDQNEKQRSIVETGVSLALSHQAKFFELGG